ncbi:MAG TPA: ATP-dependent Clp protease adaptor ClpS [Steroidobacter sp.]|uniref:ATP-dependent Clp protease adaptor ClpS n=1 Tax=Steroidobacter sp. TaxID=1978227 RepID=UPI002EDA9A9D
MSAISQLLDRVRNWFKPEPALLLPPGTSLLAMGGFVPEGFSHGIEILNDDKTPMVFVVWVLEKELGFDTKAATRTMLQIHTKGGALLALKTREEAERVASAITWHAHDRGHPLSCKAVSVDRES